MLWVDPVLVSVWLRGFSVHCISFWPFSGSCSLAAQFFATKKVGLQMSVDGGKSWRWRELLPQCAPLSTFHYRLVHGLLQFMVESSELCNLFASWFLLVIPDENLLIWNKKLDAWEEELFQNKLNNEEREVFWVVIAQLLCYYILNQLFVNMFGFPVYMDFF